MGVNPSFITAEELQLGHPTSAWLRPMRDCVLGPQTSLRLDLFCLIVCHRWCFDWFMCARVQSLHALFFAACRFPFVLGDTSYSIVFILPLILNPSSRIERLIISLRFSSSQVPYRSTMPKCRPTSGLSARAGYGSQHLGPGMEWVGALVLIMERGEGGGWFSSVQIIAVPWVTRA